MKEGGGKEKPKKIKHTAHEKKRLKKEGNIHLWEESRKKLIEEQKGPQGYPHSCSSSSDVETTEWEDIVEFYKQFHPATIKSKKKEEEIQDAKASMKDMS